MSPQLFRMISAAVIAGLLILLYLAYLNVYDLHTLGVRLYRHERLIDWFFTKVLRLSTDPYRDED